MDSGNVHMVLLHLNCDYSFVLYQVKSEENKRHFLILHTVVFFQRILHKSAAHNLGQNTVEFGNNERNFVPSEISA